MRDPFSWSVPLCRMFGITVRVHVLFIAVAIGLVLRFAVKTPQEARPGSWMDMTIVMLLLLVSVLLHEFGHCLGARMVDGDAHEVLLWPLGGLASVEVPHTARANFITAAAGPLVNLAVCVACTILLSVCCEGARPPWNPLWNPLRTASSGAITLWSWQGSEREYANAGAILLARLFYVNWLLFLANVVLVGFPLDGGRMLHSVLWPKLGFHDAMQFTIYVGFAVALVVGVAAIVMNEILAGVLACIIGVVCYRQWWLLLTEGEESVLGYDFSQGYTSLERDQPPSRRRKRPNFFQRWQQRRSARRVLREQQQREAEERRMDELLERVHRDGIQTLNDEERRFLKRVSDKYRNRQ